MKNDFASFRNLDFGTTKPTSVPQETIHAVISADNLLGDYAKSFIAEAWRKNPLRMEQIKTKLTEEQLFEYCNYLLTKRVQFVKGECEDFRKLKVLYIPVWIQYAISMVGKVIIRDLGLEIIPEVEAPSEMSLQQAIEISGQIGSLYDDLQVVQDAMPRDVYGDVDVMTTALIAGYMRSIRPVEHVSSTYLARFLGLKLREELAMQAIYRIQYDDASYIASVFQTEKRIL